jgi:succinyl-CoA synthetase beta subunit
MLTQAMKEILSVSNEIGWILEPQAKGILSSIGLDVPRFLSTSQIEEAIRFANEIGYPVVAKIVSPKIIHKSDKNGVEVGINNERKLRETFYRFSKIEGFTSVLIEEMVSGLELFVGAKDDDHFGPVILFGIGGIWVEIYRDVILRLAPLKPKDIDSMIKCLKGRPLLEGYRGSNPVNFKELNKLLMTFSEFVMDLEGFMESIDLNPVLCSSERCVVADARIMLKN